MLTYIKYADLEFEIDLEAPLDISLPVGRATGPNAFYLDEARYSTVEAGGFVGDVGRGGSCNVENISFSPHGNGTHTECIGHIDKTHVLVNNLLKKHFFLTRLLTVSTVETETGKVITAPDIESAWPEAMAPEEALVIRTLPNTAAKKNNQYSGQNPAYISKDAMAYINSRGIRHLLTDLPSVDKEDDAQLTAHHIFFNHDNTPTQPKTITEMVYADDSVTDGLYWLDLQVAGFESDASPSKPILYKVRLTYV